MSTSMVTSPKGISGNKYEIETVRDRILSMIPGAEGVPKSVLWASAQLAVSLNLNPLNGEIYIANFGSAKNPKYQPIIGVAGRRKMARRQAEYMDTYEEMSEEDLRKRRGSLYDEGDVGVTCTLYRLDMAGQCKRLGIPYSPTVASGYWRVNAREVKKWSDSARTYVGTGEFYSDNIPESWTAYEVAEKRALSNALKKAYDMTDQEQQARELGVSFDVDEAAVTLIDELAESDRRETAFTAKRPKHADDPDDDVLFATDIVDGEWSQAADEPESRPADFATDEQVARINELGNAVYGDGWGNKAAEMLPKVGGGHAGTFEEITQAQASVLINGLEKRARGVS